MEKWRTGDGESAGRGGEVRVAVPVDWCSSGVSAGNAMAGENWKSAMRQIGRAHV